ncbi:MAG TPA: Dabb family protein [Gammaproteobacteria bacterium]|nr:Dabb family protein [Gammaproteobacteria bacterium]
MIRHTILFKTKAGLSEQVIEAACADFLSLKKKLPGIVTMVGGRCALHEGKGSNVFSHAFSIDFLDKKAMNLFLTDPVTHPAKDGIVNIAEGGYAGLMGFDLEY